MGNVKMAIEMGRWEIFFLLCSLWGNFCWFRQWCAPCHSLNRSLVGCNFRELRDSSARLSPGISEALFRVAEILCKELQKNDALYSHPDLPQEILNLAELALCNCDQQLCMQAHSLFILLSFRKCGKKKKKPGLFPFVLFASTPLAPPNWLACSLLLHSDRSRNVRKYDHSPSSCPFQMNLWYTANTAMT